MKMQNNWRNKTLENLEKEVWKRNDFDSHLVKRTHALRKIPLNTFTTEDLRVMISQQIGLDYLVPLAVEVLTNDLFAEGDFFEGDLLKSVVTVKPDFWAKNPQLGLALFKLMENRVDEIEERKIDTSNFKSNINYPMNFTKCK